MIWGTCFQKWLQERHPICSMQLRHSINFPISATGSQILEAGDPDFWEFEMPSLTWQIGRGWPLRQT